MEFNDEETLKQLEEKWKVATKNYEAKTRSSQSQRDSITGVAELGKLSRAFMALEPSPSLRILDVACGNGFMDGTSYKEMGYQYIDSGHDLYGVDVAEYADYPGTFKKGLAEKLPFDNDFFDCVVCFSALIHFVRPWDAFKEAYRVLEPGGFFFLSTSLLHNEPYPWLSMYPNHIFEFSPMSIQAMFKGPGFTNILCQHARKTSYFFRGKK